MFQKKNRHNRKHKAKCAWGMWVEKTRPVLKKHAMIVSIRYNISKAYESKKPDPYYKQLVTTGVQDKICQKRMSQKNPAHARRNLSPTMARGTRPNVPDKCARDAWVEKTQPSSEETYNDRMCKVKYTQGTLIRKVQPLPLLETYKSKSLTPPPPKAWGYGSLTPTSAWGTGVGLLDPHLRLRHRGRVTKCPPPP